MIAADHIHAEIGEVISGTVTGRSNESQLTLYRSVGVVVQDASAACLVLRGAQERGFVRWRPDRSPDDCWFEQLAGH
jgi:alanine dehydrogenase